MDKVVVTSFTIIAAMACAIVFFNALYPAVVRSSDTMVGLERRAGERLKSQVKIVHAAGELDSEGAWQDINGDEDFDIFLWAKNLGSTRLQAIERCDIFLGPEGDFARIPHLDYAEGGYPHWTYQIENDDYWNPTATIKITVHFSSILTSDRYYAKIVLPNGVSDALYFAM